MIDQCRTPASGVMSRAWPIAGHGCLESGDICLLSPLAVVRATNAAKQSSRSGQSTSVEGGRCRQIRRGL